MEQIPYIICTFEFAQKHSLVEEAQPRECDRLFMDHSPHRSYEPGACGPKATLDT
jgi:hypothetical protein